MPITLSPIVIPFTDSNPRSHQVSFIAQAARVLLLTALAAMAMAFAGCSKEEPPKPAGAGAPTSASGNGSGSPSKPAPAPSKPNEEPPKQLRIGYFANLTHAQAVLGIASGEFAESVKPVPVSEKVFNAGPSLIEALFAGEIDMGYVGPVPALNGFEKSKGKELVIVSGAASNGVVIVVRKDSGIEKLEDLKGKKIATPQRGNTQDIFARRYVVDKLGQSDASTIVPIPNAEQTGFMMRGEIDAAWAPEPWGSRLVAEAGGKIIADEKDLWPSGEATLTVIVTTPEFLAKHPSTVEAIVRVSHAWTKRLNTEPAKHVPALGEALLVKLGKKLPEGVLEAAAARVKFTDEPLLETFETFAKWKVEDEGTRPFSLDGLLQLDILRKVQKEDARLIDSKAAPAMTQPSPSKESK